MSESFEEQTKSVLQAVRVGDFDHANLLLGQGALKTPKDATYLQILRARTLEAEIHDHFGRDQEAKRSLRAVGPQAENSLKSKAKAKIRLKSNEEDWKTTRQELYCLLQQSVSSYRNKDLGHAEELLDLCHSLAGRMDPQPQGLLGSLHYARGRLACQHRLFVRATEHFRLSFRSWNDRLSQKTGQLTASQHSFEQLAINYSMGKALALGVGYSLLEQGLVKEALILLAAGQVLVRSTPDKIHLNYISLLIAIAMRREAGELTEKRDLLDRAWEAMEEAEKFFRQTPKQGIVFRILFEKATLEMYRKNLSNS
jgi:tetratricopeptide (TPR) repeat protein